MQFKPVTVAEAEIPHLPTDGGALAVEIGDGATHGVVELGVVGEGLVGEMMRLEVATHRFDVVEFGRVLR